MKEWKTIKVEGKGKPPNQKGKKKKSCSSIMLLVRMKNPYDGFFPNHPGVIFPSQVRDLLCPLKPELMFTN